MELRETIRRTTMTAFQWKVVALCILLTVVDGYEILITAFTLPALIAHWELSTGQAGLVASIGTLGMGIGAVALSPLADRVGRRRLILGSLLLIVTGMVLSGLAPTFESFLAARFFAGLFLGGIVPSINVLVSEYASDQRRGSVMGVYGIGLPLGAALGGFASIELIDTFTWRGPYLAAAAVTAVLLVAAWRILPESVGYLTEKQPPRALETYNAIGARIGVPPVTSLPVPTSAAAGRRVSVVTDVFSGLMLRRTVLLWISYALLIASFYFANSLTAKLVAQTTGKPDIGITAQSLVAVGGVVGALAFAWLSSRIHPRVVTGAIMFVGTAVFLVFAAFFSNPSLVLLLAVLVGFSVNGGVAAYYAISPPIYPTAVRATAVGLMMGVGRVVAFLAPNIAAFLEERGLSAPDLYRLYGGILVLSGIAVLMLHRSYRGEDSEDAMEAETRAGSLVGEASIGTR